jgi:molecular chaperone DnaJ
MVSSHEVFKREGYDVILELPLTITEVILGTKKDIPTLYGNVTLSIASGTQSGEKQRLRGKGIENPNNGRKGDMYVIINVITPTKLDRTQKDLINKLSKTNLETSEFNRFKNYMKKNK